MPRKLPTPCSYPGCPELSHERYCVKHKRQTAKQYDKQRGTAAQRGYNARWRRARRRYLMDNPLCVMCKEKGVIQAATDVDHIIPHKGDQDLFWDESNWQALCASCHSRKTARENGSFGNKPTG